MSRMAFRWRGGIIKAAFIVVFTCFCLSLLFYDVLSFKCRLATVNEQLDCLFFVCFLRTIYYIYIFFIIYLPFEITTLIHNTV